MFSWSALASILTAIYSTYLTCSWKLRPYRGQSARSECGPRPRARSQVK